MCIIIHGLKKKHVRRAEVQEAMKTNDAGFFMAILTGKTPADRKTIRTLDEKEALEFFDKAPEDAEFVMHARIPSYGPKTLDNVHGWEEDGILFMHNMSLRNLDGFRDRFPDWGDRTDSEFFFRKLFMPFYRGYGKAAYADGQLHGDIAKFVDWVCGTSNRFLFVMPDNKVVRFGTWVSEPDRKEDGECAFYASNSSYRTFERTWPEHDGQGGSPQSGSSFRGDYDDYFAWDPYGKRYGEAPKEKRASPWDDDAGQTLRDLVGDAAVCKVALADLVARNLVEARGLLQIEGEDGASEILTDVLPSAFADSVHDAVTESFEFLADGDAESLGEDGIGLFVVNVADALQRRLAASSGYGVVPSFVSGDRILAGFRLLDKELAAFYRVANLSLDWNASSVDKFAQAYYLTKTRTGAPKMESFDPIDLFATPQVTYEAAEAAVDALLEFIRAEGEKGGDK